MAVLRRKYTGNFTVILNTLFDDVRLEADELGVMAYLLSRPADWEMRRPQLAKRFGIGRESMRRIVGNLVQYGWIVPQHVRLDSGLVHSVYEVRDEPGPTLTKDQAFNALQILKADKAESGDTGDESASNLQTRGGSPGTADQARQAAPGVYIDSLRTESLKTESTKAGEFAFAIVLESWPPDHVLSRSVAEALHLDLADAEKKKAIAGAKPYLDDCATKNRKICDLSTYYREKRWERFTGKNAREKFPVFNVGSAQWFRWIAYYRSVKQEDRVAFMEAHARQNPGGAWSEKAEWPPALQKSA